MTVDVSLNPSNNELLIKIVGRFDFSMHQDFRKLSNESMSDTKKIIIDLSKTEYVDSSALGMLLILRDKVGNDKQSIRIINAKPEVKKILQIANFDKLFLLQ